MGSNRVWAWAVAWVHASVSGNPESASCYAVAPVACYSVASASAWFHVVHVIVADSTTFRFRLGVGAGFVVSSFASMLGPVTLKLRWHGWVEFRVWYAVEPRVLFSGYGVIVNCFVLIIVGVAIWEIFL